MFLLGAILGSHLAHVSAAHSVAHAGRPAPARQLGAGLANVVEEMAPAAVALSVLDAVGRPRADRELL